MNIEDINTVCLALGPYRNLTTLTASTLFLHKNCQVLNHAWNRVYNQQDTDFLTEYSNQKLEAFIKFAIEASKDGKRGVYGGSITHSHAFDLKHKMHKKIVELKVPLIKPIIKCLFWKESLRVTNVLQENSFDFQRVFDSEKRLRFLMPIRHPLDCAQSNILTEHYKLFNGVSENPSMPEVTALILDNILWFAKLRNRFPERFFSFTEYEMSKGMLERLALFLEVDPDEDWVINALDVMESKSRYEHTAEDINFYNEYVNNNFSIFPELSKKLLDFTKKSNQHVMG